MKRGWVTGVLDDACSVEYGKRVVRKNDAGTKYPVYGGGGETFRVDDYNREDRIVIARFGLSERCTRRVAGRFFLNDSGLTLSPRNPASLTQEFLDLWTLSSNDRIYGLSRGTAQRNLDVDAFRQMAICYPTEIAEQRRIVAILDEAFEGITAAKANAEKNLRNAREVYQSAVAAAFRQRHGEWIETTVEWLAENLDNKRIPITKSKRIAGKYPYYGASGIVDYVKDFIFEGDCLLVSEDGANLLARSSPIAFSVTGKYWVNNHAHILRFTDKAAQRYVEFYLESIPLDRYVTGAAQPKLTQRAMNSIPIPIPSSLSQRQRIVDLISDMEAHTNEINELVSRKVVALDELKASLLHQAFAGNL